MTDRAATVINASAQKPVFQQESAAGLGETVALIYGKSSYGGMLIADGRIGTDAVWAWAWGFGELDAIEAFYLNDAAPPAGVTVTHYLGTTSQGVDATLAAAFGGYTDTMVISVRGVSIGIGYTVVRVTTASGIKGLPSARAVIRGRKCIDPRAAPALGGPVRVWTENPALVLNDVWTTPAFGVGGTVMASTPARTAATRWPRASSRAAASAS